MYTDMYIPRVQCLSYMYIFGASIKSDVIVGTCILVTSVHALWCALFSSSAMHEFQNLHAKAKDKIHEFVRGHFYG